MIPYFFPPGRWFGALVAFAILLGVWITRRRGRSLGYDGVKLDSFILWMLVGSFVGGHAIGDLLYAPGEAIRKPWTLLYIWRGQSSLPGFFGTLIGGLLWKYIRGRGQPIMAYSDLIISVFPISWVFGRLACTLAHDHPGTAASGPFSFLAVRYLPGNPQGIPAGPHWNLGLLEMLFAIGVSAVCIVMWRRPHRIGTFIAVVLLSYAPVRFLLDFLRTGDAQYFGLTPAQYFSIGFFALGLYVLIRSRRGAFEGSLAPAQAE